MTLIQCTPSLSKEGIKGGRPTENKVLRRLNNMTTTHHDVASKRPNCFICGDSARRYWVCPKCREDFDIPQKFEDWPEWAKFLKNDEQNRRRSQRDILDNKGNLGFIDEIDRDEVR